MKTTQQLVIAAAVALVGSTAAYAQTEVELQHFGAPSASQTTRAQVRAEVLKARAEGKDLIPAEADVAGLFQKAPALGGDVTRAQRRAEVVQAQKDGSLRPAEVDLNDRAVASTLSRDDVRKEAVAATRAGQAARVQAGH